jgi:hypothetical protein
MAGTPGAEKGAPKATWAQAAAKAPDPRAEDAKATTKTEGAPHSSAEPDSPDPNKEASATPPAARQEAGP